MTLSLPPALSRAVVGRSAHRRGDAAWLAAAWASPGTGVLVLHGGAVGAVETEGPGGAEPGGLRLAAVAPEQAPAGEQYFLGEHDGRAWFVVVAAQPPVLPRGVRPVDLRTAGALLDDHDAGLLTHAVALTAWHERSTHCSRCGGPTRVTLAGAARVCEVCGAEHHPRTDPAVIMLVHDGAGRCVLGRQAGWPQGMASTLAGFVEPGESAEMAVAREVAEEVGLVVDPATVAYVGSQPWPFPASLMLAFTAQAAPTDLVVDPVELEQARWWSRPEMLEAVAGGALRLPPPVSIAHRLITGWLAGG